MNDQIEKLFEEFKKQVIAIINDDNADEQEPEIDEHGIKRWYKMIDGKKELHRDGDKPAIICADGTKEWYRDGKCHRDGDNPAVIDADGTKEWYRDAKCHRDGDKPAVIDADGTKEYYVRGTKVPAP